MKHFYIDDPEPAPFYEVPYADPSKGMRPTTLADARKVGAFPSPNTIMSVLAKPGLERWKRNQWGDCVAETTLEFGSWNDDDRNHAETMFSDRMNAAPSAGTIIHAAIENALLERMGREERHPPQDVDTRIVEAALNWLDDHRVEPIVVEMVFTNSAFGFGGKLDLLALRPYGNLRRRTFVDWKSVETKDGKVSGDYWKDKTPLLAAYAVGSSLSGVAAAATIGTFFEEVDCCNVFLSRNEPGVVHARMYNWGEMIFGWKKFQLAYELWCLENNYDARRTQ